MGEEAGPRLQWQQRAGGLLSWAAEAVSELCGRGAYELICVEGDRVEGEARALGCLGGH